MKIGDIEADSVYLPCQTLSNFLGLRVSNFFAVSSSLNGILNHLASFHRIYVDTLR